MTKLIGKVSILALTLLLLLPDARGQTRMEEMEGNRIAFGNEKISFVFEKSTGQLKELQNKVTGGNYLKNPSGANLFRLFIDPEKEPPLSAEVYTYSQAGSTADPVSGSLKEYLFYPQLDGGELALRYSAPGGALEILLSLRLEHDADYADCRLYVKNNAVKASHSLYTAFPFFSGIMIGDRASDNLAINMWDRGYPGSKAWEKPLGGVYGREVAMQWQCVYKDGSGEGLSFITMDTTLANKILCTSPGGGMQAFYFDKQILLPGDSVVFPEARIQLFSGGWRVAAAQYDRWFKSAMKPREIPAWYSKIGMRGSTWFPPSDRNTEYGSIASVSLRSYRDMFSLYAGRYDDLLEIAQWNEDVNLWPETYGPWMSSGLLGFRSDLGGEEAFREGVRRVQKAGRKVGLYVAGYGIRKTSPLFNGDSWKEWAIQDKRGNYNFDYRQGDQIYGIFVCPGYKPWQEHITRICKMLAKTGIDEIRLDELGFPFKPCYNGHHNHDSPYDANKWMSDYLRRVRAAIDSINPQLVLTTEFFVDYFNRYTNGALVMDYSGKEIDAMKAAMPQYLPLSYHAGAAEAAITGAIPGKPMSQRHDWAWQHIGANPMPDYGKTPDIGMQWHNLFHTFSPALVFGTVSSMDPVAKNDTLWQGHLWRAKDYYLLTGGYDDARPLLQERIEVIVPETDAVFTHAYEYDLISGAMKQVGLEKQACRGIKLDLHNSVSAVFLPLPNCPPLPVMKEIEQNSERVSVRVSLLSDWSGATLINGDIKVESPGFQVSNVAVENKTITFDLKPVSADLPEGNYFFCIEGKVLPLKHWFGWY